MKNVSRETFTSNTDRRYDMTREENIRAILECNFAGFKGDIIDIAVKRICEIEQELKQGHWIDIDVGFSPCECSNCKSVEFKKSKYCPNCGAKMESEEEHESKTHQTL